MQLIIVFYKIVWKHFNVINYYIWCIIIDAWKKRQFALSFKQIQFSFLLRFYDSLHGTSVIVFENDNALSIFYVKFTNKVSEDFCKSSYEHGQNWAKYLLY